MHFLEEASSVGDFFFNPVLAEVQVAEVPSHVGGFGMEDSSLVILLDACGSLFPADGVEDSAVGDDL